MPDFSADAGLGGGSSNEENPESLLAMAQQQFGTFTPIDFSQYAGGGGGAWALGGGTPPPELAQYFDAQGGYKIDDPRQVAAEGGISLAQLAGGLMPRWKDQWQGYEYPSDKGGFFKIEDLFGLTGPATLSEPQDASQGGSYGPSKPNPSHIDVPQAATRGMNLPSTNNWRLLGMGPGWIMRNGQLIDTQDLSTKFGYSRGRMPTGGVTAEHYVPFAPLALGGGTSVGAPNLVSPGGGTGWATGWPGSASPWTKGGAIDVGMGY